MATPSRIEQARRKLRIARIGIGAIAVAGLGVFGVAARASHPGSSTPATSSRTQSAAATTDDQSQANSSFGFDSGSIGSGSSTPSVQSSGS